MRPFLLQSCLFFILAVTDAFGVEKIDGDNYLACLVGQGAVEMRHKMTAEQALTLATNTCKGVLERSAAADTSREPDWSDAVRDLAARSLRAIEAAHDIF